MPSARDCIWPVYISVIVTMDKLPLWLIELLIKGSDWRAEDIAVATEAAEAFSFITTGQVFGNGWELGGIDPLIFIQTADWWIEPVTSGDQNSK